MRDGGVDTGQGNGEDDGLDEDPIDNGSVNNAPVGVRDDDDDTRIVPVFPRRPRSRADAGSARDAGSAPTRPSEPWSDGDATGGSAPPSGWEGAPRDGEGWSDNGGGQPSGGQPSGGQPSGGQPSGGQPGDGSDDPDGSGRAAHSGGGGEPSGGESSGGDAGRTGTSTGGGRSRLPPVNVPVSVTINDSDMWPPPEARPRFVFRCREDHECARFRGVCDRGRCVQCRSSLECAPGSQCTSDHVCARKSP